MARGNNLLVVRALRGGICGLVGDHEASHWPFRVSQLAAALHGRDGNGRRRHLGNALRWDERGGAMRMRVGGVRACACVCVCERACVLVLRFRIRSRDV